MSAFLTPSSSRLGAATQPPVYVAIVWHMHQPYYKDIRTGKYIMPWVRLHATKDYVDMVEVLAEFPEVKATFNMVPSLMEQIDDMVENGATDLVWDMTERPAAALNDGEKKFILQKFFYAHYDHMIKPYPRYRELFDKRGWAKDDAELTRAMQYFNEQDLRDLQVWYNLCWVDPLHLEKDPELAALVARGRDFSEAEKLMVLERHKALCARVAPVCREAQARGQIEVTCTPFYHPIMPLVYNTDLARVARPEVELPRHKFSHPEDVQWHVRSAVEYHERSFGKRPVGMWPSEGSVAPEILPLLAEHGIQWIATDEEVLAMSTGQQVKRDLSGKLLNPELLYQPYYAEHNGAKVAMVFRDHFMSDLIGFQYAGWRSEDAAGDLISRLETIAREAQAAGRTRPLLVPIILDGENCWEHYQQDGIPFLRALYGGLQKSRLLCTTTPGEFIEKFPPQVTLPRLHAGSWINHDFSIWLGHKEDNQSWDYLFEVREAVAAHIEANRASLTEEQIQQAWKEIYIAEGSDWNWWYGDDHSSGIDDEFDQLYRDHLMGACLAIGLQPPSFLYIPITTGGLQGTDKQPRAFLAPEIDGRNTSYYEWFAAGMYDPSLGGGSMHQAQYLVRRIYYGFDRETLFFRIDADQTLMKPGAAQEVQLDLMLISGSQTYRVRITLVEDGETKAQSGSQAGISSHLNAPLGQPGLAVLSQQLANSNEFRPVVGGGGVIAAAGSIVEVAVPMAGIGAEPGSEVYFYVGLRIDNREVERAPVRTPLRLETPTPDFETRMWIV